MAERYTPTQIEWEHLYSQVNIFPHIAHIYTYHMDYSKHCEWAVLRAFRPFHTINQSSQWLSSRAIRRYQLLWQTEYFRGTDGPSMWIGSSIGEAQCDFSALAYRRDIYHKRIRIETQAILEDQRSQWSTSMDKISSFSANLKSAKVQHLKMGIWMNEWYMYKYEIVLSSNDNFYSQI